MRKIPPVITRSETIEEFLARGGQIRKLKTVDPEAQLQKDIKQAEKEANKKKPKKSKKRKPKPKKGKRK